MNYKSCALVMLLLSSQVGIAEPIVYQHIRSKTPTQSASVTSKPSGGFASRWLSLKKSVRSLVSSATKSTSTTLSSTKQSVVDRLAKIIRSYPKSCATAAGILSYFSVKPLVNQYMDWDSEDKSFYAFILGDLTVTIMLGLWYVGKLPSVPPKIAASFIAGLGATGLFDQLYASCKETGIDSQN